MGKEDGDRDRRRKPSENRELLLYYYKMTKDRKSWMF